MPDIKLPEIPDDADFDMLRARIVALTARTEKAEEERDEQREEVERLRNALALSIEQVANGDNLYRRTATERDALKAELDTRTASIIIFKSQALACSEAVEKAFNALKTENAELREKLTAAEEKLRWKKWPEEKPDKRTVFAVWHDGKYTDIDEAPPDVALTDWLGDGWDWGHPIDCPTITHWREITGPEDSDD